ncbi:hypothetical protein ACI789_21045 [Geodermatophilus sp. SYSU D00965]
MTDDPPPIERHEAADRFGKAALRAAHRLTEAMGTEGMGTEGMDTEGRDDDEDGVPDPIVVRRTGPHRSIDGLAALLDEALAEPDEGGPDAAGRGEREPR